MFRYTPEALRRLTRDISNVNQELNEDLEVITTAPLGTDCSNIHINILRMYSESV